MKTKFTIGQLSLLFHIPIKTLRYYDEIGLFQPAFVEESSHYRYYSTEQFEQLHTIQYLKILGMPLKNIKNHLKTADMDSFLNLLKEHKELTERKIIELTQIQQSFEKRIEEIEMAKEIGPLGEIFLRQLPPMKVFRLEAKITTEPELELILNQLEQKANANANIFIGKVGLTVSKENLLKKKFDEYNSIFLLTEQTSSALEEASEALEAGLYACYYFRGGHCDSPPHYLKILNFLEENQYEISGDAIERTIIDQYISKDKGTHLTEIRIPIKSS